jgi:hypothetical protein
MAATETRTRDQLAAAIAEIASPVGVSHEIWPLTISPQEAALLLDALEPKKPAFEGWADVELMGHRRRIAYVRELELAHRGFLELTWRDSQEIEHREIYSASAVFSLTPLDNEHEAHELRGRITGEAFVSVRDDDDDDDDDDRIPF